MVDLDLTLGGVVRKGLPPGHPHFRTSATGSGIRIVVDFDLALGGVVRKGLPPVRPHFRTSAELPHFGSLDLQIGVVPE